MKLQDTRGYQIIHHWLRSKGFYPFHFQEEAWHHIINGASGLVNAPTGCGKTFAVFLGALIDFINRHPGDFGKRRKNGLQLLWITPLRALAKDIARAMQEVITDLGMGWEVGVRNGDTSPSERAKQKRQMPEVLVITPESLHLLLAQKGYPSLFESLKLIAVDEWHELLGTKRGVQVELALSRLVGLARITNRNNQISVWGISATIGNLEEARQVLLHPLQITGVTVVAELSKNIEILSVFPDEIEKYPWAGHLGLNLAVKILPIIRESRTTLVFINTRGMSERWYQALLTLAPELAGSIALHHGSIDMELRNWVEDNLHTGNLKVVVCTSSLDLGVDFRPVETVIQVGSPKGVARFLQRAGRSGHSPEATSRIYFLPTHSLELLEAAALKSAISERLIESREPRILCFDVLIQYLHTLAVGEGFLPHEILPELRATWCFRDMDDQEWQKTLHFLTEGGQALGQYDEYRKVEIDAGVFRIRNRRLAMRHRLHIGTIVSDPMMKVKFLTGGYVGMIEEYFISRLSPGDVFTLAGRQLEFVMIKDMTALVRRTHSKKAIVPSWEGGRVPLSANLGKKLRATLDKSSSKELDSEPELEILQPLLQLQAKLSYVPKENELLIEQIETRDGFHLFVYPFEGRLVHEAMAAILAYRISRSTPISFSFAMNDYGFELLSDQPIPVDDSNVYELFSPENLLHDIQRSVNSTEMARRKFRDIAVIGGLVFPGYPGEQKKARHLQASASLLFNVFSEYDPQNLLLRQAYQEIFDQQMEEQRLREMLQRVQRSRIILKFPDRLTPFCFPIKVDSMREDLSSEKMEDRVRKMQLQLEAMD
ncbi:MAG TPA: ligase-associated DNA damage response DEXH box helicase [Chitinophagaceae bacterium]|nr:ligase-associated DNA damage response DEXH box helicase [Chitinophagaceae bacterium]